MKKKLTKHGNSLALVIEKPILELLGIDADTELEVSTDGRSLIVTPRETPSSSQGGSESVGVTPETREKIKRINRRYEDMFRNLAKGAK